MFKHNTQLWVGIDVQLLSKPVNTNLAKVEAKSHHTATLQMVE